MSARKPRHRHAPSHSHTTTHGNTTITATKHGHTTTTTKTTKHGNRRTTTTTVTRGGKVIRSSRSTVVVGKAHHGGSHKPAKPKRRGAPGDVLAGSWWVTGGNDVLETCVPVALANSYLIATARRIADSQILALAGPRSIAECLDELGFACRPAEGLSDGVVLGLTGAHAATWLDGGAVSWGALSPVDAATVEEAWEVDWR
jgi:hypothetical protein